MTFITNTHVSGISLGQRFSEFYNTIKDRLARANIHKTTVSELSALSNRDLADLGIPRCSIENLAMEIAYGK